MNDSLIPVFLTILIAIATAGVMLFLGAMLFILFDVEAAFLYPWGVTFRDFAGNRLFVLGEMVVFLGILVVGFVYLWWRGALNWE